MASPNKIGIIGGTGFSHLVEKFKEMETDYGSVNVSEMVVGGKRVFFVPRHRNLETPDRVNYRANIQALVRCGVRTVLAVTAGGRLAKEVLPGHLVFVTDVDWDDATGRHREMSFAEPGLLLHASMEKPFSPKLNHYMAWAWADEKASIERIYEDSPDLKVDIHDNGTYFNINGPAFSTPAREARIRNTVVNPKLIGQTLVPEVHLAREMGLAYAAIGMCVDHSNFPDAKPVTHADGVMHAAQKTSQAALEFLNHTIKRIPDDFHDETAHDSLKHSLHPDQVDFQRLIDAGRPRLAQILREKLGI